MVKVNCQYKVRGQKVSSITSLTSHLDSFYPGNGSYLYHITISHPGPWSPYIDTVYFAAAAIASVPSRWKLQYLNFKA